MLRKKADSAWLSTPDSLLLPANGRQFDIRIDTASLAPGVYYDEVQAWDAAAEWRGPLARVPVTVCKPHVLPVGPDGTYTPSQCAQRPHVCLRLDR